MPNRTHPSGRLRKLVSSLTTGLTRPLLGFYGQRRNLMRLGSRYAQDKLAACRAKLSRGETIYLLGLGCAGHNAGAGLVKATTAGIEVIANHEEERFRGIKHCKDFPHHSVAAAILDLQQRGLTADDLDAVVASWDYVELGARLAGHIAAELPGSIRLLHQQASPTLSFCDLRGAFDAPFKLATHSESQHSIPIIALSHHDNHAFFSLGVSPFADSSQKTLVAVIDGLGDDSPISLYCSQGGKLERFYQADRLFDSIGQMYMHLSSTQGGWPALSSEGRYMGAAAWGDTNRMTNPYYRPLRALFHFGPQGKLWLNDNLANWHRGGSLRPYRKRLAEILGPPIDPDQMWNPDQVLSVEDIEHAPITRDRVDKAAATQMLFEDAIFHVIDHGLRYTEASQAVFAGGAALNCVASSRLLEHFNEGWYERYLNQQQTRLHLWVPPTPGDAGAPMGAAFHFAHLAGARPQRLQRTPLNPFLCGQGPTRECIEQALAADPEIDSLDVGSVRTAEETEMLADLMAYIVSQDGVIGIMQGPAETGPRALGHRSILANPTNPNTLDLLNSRVKFRERVRPLAPMATLEAAKRFFKLADGASDNAFDAYSYMVLTARANAAARQQIPAVVHHDGSSRVQIVRKETDPLMHCYLRALGHRLGVEVSVNTSLNVGSPIVQTSEQAFHTLRRSKGLHGIFLVADDGSCQVAWHNVTGGAKDGGRQIKTWIRQWQDNDTLATPEPSRVAAGDNAASTLHMTRTSISSLALVRARQHAANPPISTNRELPVRCEDQTELRKEHPSLPLPRITHCRENLHP